MIVLWEPPLTESFATPISGGVSILLCLIEESLDGFIIHLINDIHPTYTHNQELLRVKRATTKQSLENYADAIAEEVNAERRVTPKTLCCAGHTKANNVN